MAISIKNLTIQDFLAGKPDETLTLFDHLYCRIQETGSI